MLTTNPPKHGGPQARCVAAAAATSRQHAPGERRARQPDKAPPPKAHSHQDRMHGTARKKRGADTEQDAKLAKRHNHLAVLFSPARILLSFGPLILRGVGANEFSDVEFDEEVECEGL